MAKINQATLYQTQVSLTEWFEKLGHKNIEKFRVEDNDKRERLGVLNEVIGLPFDRPTQFPVLDLINQPPAFKKFLKDRGKELCALRLIPSDPKLEKLRMRGLTINKAMDWFAKQKIDYKKYKADFMPHSDRMTWSTIFIVNPKGIFGEIIKGGHYQLTQGFHDSGEPITFSFDFKKLSLSKKDKKLEKYLKDIFKKILVKDKKKQSTLKKKLNSKFERDYLVGYFETVDQKEFGLWFVDYNRILGGMYSSTSLTTIVSGGKNIVTGQIGSPGRVFGKVKIVYSKNINGTLLERDEILVCDMTTPECLPLMQQALAIVTDFGGILSHAAIVARELQKPCIAGTKNATQVLKDGDLIEVDANMGIVRIL